MNAQTGIINIRGKEYQTVALRVQLFREQHPDHSLTTAVIVRDDDCVVMQATIADPTGRIIANGHSEEYRKASQINKTSALENAETSAIGRALAAFGLGGTEFASANEVVNAIHQQGNGGEAARGQGKESKVSPAASDLKQKLEQSVEQGKQPAHSALKTELRQFVRELESCGDWDTYAAFRETPDYKRLTSDCETKLPEWWDGGESMPAEFVPLRRRIEILEANLAESKAAIATA